MSRIHLLFRAAALVAASAAMAACGGSDDPAPAPAPAPAPVALPAPPLPLAAPTADTFTRPASPVVVSSTLDDARSASATIGRAGGGITATGEDGTRYSFTVPPNALPEDTLITMTPIASTTGAPWSVARGVRFAPASLQFYRHATLQIEPPAAMEVPIDEQVMMGAEADELFIATPDRSATPRIKLLHFTDYWFARMTRAQLDAQRLRSPTLTSLALEQQVAAMIAVVRQCQLLGGGDLCDDSAIAGALGSSAIYKSWVDNVVKPLITNAKFCEDYKNIIRLSLGLERQRQLLGFGDDSSFGESTSSLENISPEVATLVRNTVPFGNVYLAGQYTCVKESSQRCKDFGFFDLFVVAIGLERQAQLLGVAPGQGPLNDTTYLKIEERVRACYNFKIEFDSTLTVTGIPGAVNATSRVSARINDYNPGVYLAQALSGVPAMPSGGGAPLVNDEFTVTPPSCGTASSIARGGSGLGAEFTFQSGASGRPKAAKLGLTLGNTGEAWTVDGCGIGSLRYGPKPVWTDAFLQAHADTRFEVEGLSRGAVFEFGQAELPLNGATLLSKTWNRSVGNVQENTVVKVIHAPMPFTEPALPLPAP
ncbi:MAG: hypothetical protein ABL916_11190 [Burkholderiaceae bacterium]